MHSSRGAIDRYHGAMFHGETPHPAWLDECADYLAHVFGNVAGQTVVDYGFGRGNWTLAFLRLGAARVISVDASATAVERFRAYLAANQIGNVEVVCGNTDQEHLSFDADIVFAYGILQHLVDAKGFLTQAAAWIGGNDGRILLYAYDAGSWRETLLSRCRRVAGPQFEALGDWEFLLHPSARHRAVDDLLAPQVSFWSPAELQDALADCGLMVRKQARDFAHFQGKSLAPEFDPYVIVSGRPARGEQPGRIEPNAHPLTADCGKIAELFDVALSADVPVDNAIVVIGVFNTVFACNPRTPLEDRLFYLWLYLCGLILKRGGQISSMALPHELRLLVEATATRSPAALREFEASHGDGFLVQRISRGNYRI